MTPDRDCGPTQTRTTITDAEMVRWLDACAADPSIITPWELGYRAGKATS